MPDFNDILSPQCTYVIKGEIKYCHILNLMQRLAIQTKTRFFIYSYIAKIILIIICGEKNHLTHHLKQANNQVNTIALKGKD